MTASLIFKAQSELPTVKSLVEVSFKSGRLSRRTKLAMRIED
jgi:hypothetical protein